MCVCVCVYVCVCVCVCIDCHSCLEVDTSLCTHTPLTQPIYDSCKRDWLTLISLSASDTLISSASVHLVPVWSVVGTICAYTYTWFTQWEPYLHMIYTQWEPYVHMIYTQQGSGACVCVLHDAWLAVYICTYVHVRTYVRTYMRYSYMNAYLCIG